MTNETKISKAAAMLGRRGGTSKSEAKKQASRANGKKGGRPRRGVREVDGAESTAA
jgi:hypothetical protein